MTDWDLLTPGIGLTSIGIVGVGISLSGIAKTFLDGMHAVSLLTMFIGMIFLASGLFKDGFPTSDRAKSATFITLGLLVTFGFTAAVTTGTQTPSIFAYIGLMLLIAIPATVLTVASYRRTPYIKALAVIFIGAAVVGGSTFFAFGLVTPTAPSAVEEEGVGGGETAGDDNTNNQQPGQQQQQQTTQQPVELTKVAILPGSSAEGNPDYDPENLAAPKGVGIQWINDDNVPHTVTSLKDDGKSFDSSIILPNGNYTLDTSVLDESEYEYFCTIHPYMKAKFTMGTDAAVNASGPNSQNNSGTGNISTAAGSKQQAASGTNENTTENISNGNNSTEGIINAAKNNSINEPQVSSANGTSVINMNTGTSTPSISTVSIVSGSSLPSNGEFYVPETVETTVGSMINWKNDDFGPHTVTSGDMTTGKTGVFDSNIMQKGSTFSFLFDKVGEYDYFCTLHPFMTGRISVK
ncbi:MAG TPA: plastocyanin/azurin family copper-binding protein [Nitrososphaeraceae archaeon]|nr:plastocyanin/azurin family copper-binding protein [Nitrososphaeraceae archaeon]